MRPASRETRSNRLEKKEGESNPSRQSNSPSFNGSADFWKAALGAHPDVLTVHSPYGVVLFANEKMLEICGRRIDEIQGRNCSDLFHSEDSYCPHEEVMETGVTYKARQPVLMWERYFNLTIDPIRDESGRVAGYLRTMRDVTDIHKLREQLIRAEQLATLGQMINGIAHDVGTPLNIISGYSEYLLMRLKTDAQGYNEISTILQQTRRIAEYIKQMLDLARPAQGRADAIALNSFLKDSIDLISHHLRKTDVKAALSDLEVAPVIYGDAPRLRQAFFNLFLNACCKVGGGGSIDIVIGGRDGDSNFVKVSLFGVDAAGKAHDFSNSLRGFISSGGEQALEDLGLTLARELFDRFGATISSYDAGERGRPVVVKLPIKVGSEASPHINR